MKSHHAIELTESRADARASVAHLERRIIMYTDTEMEVIAGYPIADPAYRNKGLLGIPAHPVVQTGQTLPLRDVLSALNLSLARLGRAAPYMMGKTGFLIWKVSESYIISCMTDPLPDLSDYRKRIEVSPETPVYGVRFSSDWFLSNIVDESEPCGAVNDLPAAPPDRH
jgi:hypothetical protein